MADKKIKARIQALLAKANSTTNEHEAEAFMAKAMELLRQHQLDINDLTDADDPILHHTGLKGAKSGHQWRWRLYSAVAKFYGCQSIHVPVGVDYEQRLVGRESAIITVDLMYPWIVSQVRSKAKDIVRDHKERYGKSMSEQGQAKRVAAALIARIHRLIAERKPEEAAPTEAARNALIVINNQVQRKFDELYPETESLKSRARTDDASKKAADSIGLYRQAGGKEQLRIK